MSQYELGQWEMFIEISNAYYGKQYYFLQDNGWVYSRKSCKYMNVYEAYNEFIKEIRED
jgi:hypothetical protein